MKYKLYDFNHGKKIPFKVILTKKVLPIFLSGSCLVFLNSSIIINNGNKDTSSDIKVIEEVNNSDYVIYDVENNIAVETSDTVLKDMNYSEEKLNEFDYKDINNYFQVGSSPYIQNINDFFNTEAGEYVKEYSQMYGVDPNIIAAICQQETCLDHYACIPGGAWYNGAGVGIMQIEKPEQNNTTITAYNYLTNQEDSIVVSMENAIDLEKNIQIGIMMFQENIKELNGNIYLAIQAHNYSYSMIKLMLSKNYNSDINEIINDYSDISWLNYIKDVHNNPTKYLNNDWPSNCTYGDGDYISNVLRYCISDTCEYYCGEEKIEINLKTSEVINREVIPGKKL